jgi:hypothetical protein
MASFFFLPNYSLYSYIKLVGCWIFQTSYYKKVIVNEMSVKQVQSSTTMLEYKLH